MARGADLAVDLETTSQRGVIKGLVVLRVLPRVVRGVETDYISISLMFTSCCASFPSFCFHHQYHSPFFSRGTSVRNTAELVVVPGYRADGQGARRGEESGVLP